jgi:hypothetical protein
VPGLGLEGVDSPDFYWYKQVSIPIAKRVLREKMFA